MLYFYTGTDTIEARKKLNAVLEKAAGEVIRITDAHSAADLNAALQGGGMFGGVRIVVLDSVFTNDELGAILFERLPILSKSKEVLYIYESAPNAALKKTIEKYAEKTEKFELKKGEKKDNFFGLINAFQQGKKKDLWVLYQREIAAGKAPEMLHGSFFWGAKQMLLKSRNKEELARGRRLVADLAALPHEARRNGFDLEYALEHFVLARL